MTRCKYIYWLVLENADHSSTKCSMKNHFEVSLHTHQSSRFHVNGKRSFDGNDQDLAEIACAYLLSTQSKRCEVFSNETLPCKSFGSKKVFDITEPQEEVQWHQCDKTAHLG